MSRLKKLTNSLLSGYVMLASNMLYTLASVPLALHYLNKEEFGLWALVSQLGAYITLIDLGMSGSVARILIDHKDDRGNGAYGGVIKTGALVGFVQGGLIVLAGIGLSVAAGSLLHVPAGMNANFTWLMIGQSLLMGVSFSTRIFGNLLLAHQRLDVTNYSSSVLFFVNLAAMWTGFAMGLGIYSFLIGQFVMIFGSVVVNITGCTRLGFLPRGNEWGQVTYARFHEVFKFGNDIFIYTLGTQLISASQTILLTRLLGLESAAVWNVCTRTYTMLTMIIFRFFDYSAPGLAEMMVRNEKELLFKRFKQIVGFSLAVAVAAGGMFALCNSPFIAIWSSHKISWSPINDLLLAAWLVVCVNMRLHTGLVGQTKKLRFMRYIFLIEGTVFIGLTILFYKYGGITAMLILSIICTSLFTMPYGLYRTAKYFSLNWQELAGWHKPALLLACRLAPVGFPIWWMTHHFPAMWQLGIGGSVFGLWTAWTFLRYGIHHQLQAELLGLAPAWAKTVLARTVFEPKKAPHI